MLETSCSSRTKTNTYSHQRQILLWVFFQAFLVLIFEVPALSHAVAETRFNSPIPGWIVLIAATAVLLLSFILLNRYKTKKSSDCRSTQHSFRPASTFPLLKWIFQNPRIALLTQIISVGLFLLVLLAGFFGNPKTEFNATSSLIWILFWFGLSLFSFLVGNPWGHINPLLAIYKWTGMRRFSFHIRYPQKLGAWPALILYISFIWFELSWFQSDEPRSLATITVFYSIYIWAGLILFGKDWMNLADPFTRYFQVLGLFAPIGHGEHTLEVRPYGAALRRESLKDNLSVIFIISIMYSVTYDGYMATQEWIRSTSALMEIAINAFPGIPVMEGVQLILLSSGLVIFAACYYGSCAWMSCLAGHKNVGELARAFGLSLLPIAFGYYLAHFFNLILPRFIELGIALSDPMGYEATSLSNFMQHKVVSVDYRLKTEVVWTCQVILIVSGHTISIVTAHQIAQRILTKAKRFTLCQLPLLLMMILYTWISLWITSRPLLHKPLIPIMENLLKDIT